VSSNRAVADGLPVDAAVAAGRTAVSMDSALEWGTPVLYMRSPDGRIFDIATSVSRAKPTPETEDRQAEDPLHRYREGVESAWTGGELDKRQAERLRDLANELGLTPSATADIEREVMGDTIETILKRQEQAAREEERNRWLEELYTQAHRLHQDRKWQAVIDVFEQIRAEDSAYPDREGLLASAREALEAQDLARRVTALYAEGQRHMEAEEWSQAIEYFEDIQRLEPNYREIRTLLAQARQQVSANHTEKVEARERQRQQTSGRSTDHAERVQPDYSIDTQSQRRLPMLGRNWWALALCGLIMVILGLFNSFLPHSVDDDVVFVGVFGGFLIIANSVVANIASRTALPKLLLRIQSMISGVAGLVILLSGVQIPFFGPATFSEALQVTPFLVVHGSTFDLWVICIGIVQIIAAIRLGWDFKVMQLLLVVSAMALIVYGIYSLSLLYRWTMPPNPWLLGFWLLASGLSLVGFAFRAWHWDKSEVGG
jgi:uncharacterized membrane protein HdeD (DUF308 family)